MNKKGGQQTAGLLTTYFNRRKPWLFRTRAELAVAAGISRPHLSNQLKGTRAPSLNSAAKLAVALRLTLQEVQELEACDEGLLSGLESLCKADKEWRPLTEKELSDQKTSIALGHSDLLQIIELLRSHLIAEGQIVADSNKLELALQELDKIPLRVLQQSMHILRAYLVGRSHG